MAIKANNRIWRQLRNLVRVKERLDPLRSADERLSGDVKLLLPEDDPRIVDAKGRVLDEYGRGGYNG